MDFKTSICVYVYAHNCDHCSHELHYRLPYTSSTDRLFSLVLAELSWARRHTLFVGGSQDKALYGLELLQELGSLVLIRAYRVR